MKFNQYELFFLGGLLDVESILGAPNPFLGFLEEDIQVAWAKTVDSLFKRGVFFLNEGEVFLNGEAASLIQICGSPVAALVKHDSSNGSYEGYLHFSDEVVIEKFEEHDQFALTVAGTPEFVVNKLVQNVIELQAKEPITAKLPVKVWNELNQLGMEISVKELEDKLFQHQMNPDTASNLAKVLQEKISVTRFIIMKYGESGWNLQTAGFLNSPNQSLSFELDSQQEHVYVSSVTQDEMLRKLRNAMSLLQEV